MKTYAEYKNSGIPWIGEIPKGWEVAQLRRYLKMVSEKNYPNEQLLSVTREKGVIVRDIDSKEENHNFIPDDLSNYKLVKVGQFAVNKMKSWQGSYGVSNFQGIVSPAYYVCDLKNIDASFFGWAIRSKAYIPFFTQMSKGIRVGQWDLSTFALKEIPFCEPSPAEQRAIVAFLETKTKQINDCIALRERELQTLNELKQAQIAQVVTKGLNHSAPMKDSGIPWIGEIPKGWEVRRNKVFLSEKKEVVGDRTNFPLLSLTKEGIILRDIESGKGKFPKDFNTYKIVNKEDIIFCLFDIDETPRTVGLSNLNGMITGAYNVFSIKNINKKYLYYTYLAIDNKKGLRPLYTGLRKVVNTDKFLSSKMPIPPLEEQQAIVSYIDNSTQTINSYISHLEKEIEHLKEYKQRLISDVVTGKIDVRDEA